MPKKPAVSVVIPVYNVEATLPRCLDSLLAQTFTDWEAVCINDGSPDGSAAILEKYAASDARFRVIDKKNAGVSAARNDGVAAAHGEYVMYLDSDDFIHPQTLQIAHFLARSCNAEIVSFRHDRRLYRALRRAGRGAGEIAPDMRVYDPSRVRFKKTDNLLGHATEKSHSFGFWRVRHCYPVMHLMRLELARGACFPTDIKISEDFPWWSDILLRRPRAVITRLPLYYYIPNPSSALGGADCVRVFENVARAITRAYDMYAAAADRAQMRTWSREFLWPFVIIMMRAVRGISDPAGLAAARAVVREMQLRGVFDNPASMRARKYLRRIREFVK